MLQASNVSSDAGKSYILNGGYVESVFPVCGWLVAPQQVAGSENSWSTIDSPKHFLSVAHSKFITTDFIF